MSVFVSALVPATGVRAPLMTAASCALASASSGMYVVRSASTNTGLGARATTMSLLASAKHSGTRPCSTFVLSSSSLISFSCARSFFVVLCRSLLPPPFARRNNQPFFASLGCSLVVVAGGRARTGAHTPRWVVVGSCGKASAKDGLCERDSNGLCQRRVVPPGAAPERPACAAHRPLRVLAVPAAAAQAATATAPAL